MIFHPALKASAPFVAQGCGLAERGLAGSTLNQRRAVLSGIFKRARREFRVNVDPMDGFERAPVTASGDFDVYSVEEVWALVRAAAAGAHHTGQRAYTRTTRSGRKIHVPARPFTTGELAGRRDQDLYDAAAILTAALCGLRRSGLLGLRWRAVLWEQNAILVRRGFTEGGGDRLPKGQRVYSVPAARQVLDLLGRLQAVQGDPLPDERVFQGPGGTPMDGSSLYRRYREIQAAAGVRALRFHDLRHTFGTQAIASGAHVNDVKEWMGHRHLSTPWATSTTGRVTRPRPRSSVTSPAPPPSSISCLASPETSTSGRRTRAPDTTLGDSNKSRKAATRGHFVVIFACAPMDREPENWIFAGVLRCAPAQPRMIGAG